MWGQMFPQISELKKVSVLFSVVGILKRLTVDPIFVTYAFPPFRNAD